MDAVATQLKKIGAKVLTMANDLKRTPEALSTEIAVGLKTVESVIEGSAPLEDAQLVVQKMARTYPVDGREMWADKDESDAGVTIMRVAASRQSSRIFKRVDRDDNPRPYYEYRDTAMALGSPIKPEWIAPLRVVNDVDPSNRDVIFNNGHLLHQVTFFIGPVNFYWEVDGIKYCEELNTGDSNFITPFVPHSFAVRPGEQQGLIIAVTYGAQIRRAIDEVSSFDAAELESLAGDLRSQRIFSVRLRRLLDEASFTDQYVLSRLQSTGFSEAEASSILSGAAPNPEHLHDLAEIISVRTKDLMIDRICDQDVVSVQRRTTPYSYPSDAQVDYEIRQLAKLSTQPNVRGMELTVRSAHGAEFKHHLHQYVYNFGKYPAVLRWGNQHEAILEPGDSATIHPMISHSFGNQELGECARLVVVRVPGSLTHEALDEYAAFDKSGRVRTTQETRRWF